jgi:hypothetical protein
MAPPRRSGTLSAGGSEPVYPKPRDRVELSAYRTFLVAQYFDDVKKYTPQLLRAIVFLWLVFIFPWLIIIVLVLGYIISAVNWVVLPFDWKWLTGVGCLGTTAIGLMGLKRIRSRVGAIGRSGSPDSQETVQDRIV